MIRKAKINDAKRIAEIYVFSSKAAYIDIVSDNHLQKTLNMKKKIEEYSNKISNKLEEIYVYEENNILSAFISFRESNNIKNKFFELLQIYVDPQMKNKGIGKIMINFLENISIKSKVDEIFLWVIKNNKSARIFYEKNGFSSDRQERFLKKYNVSQIKYSKRISEKGSYIV